MDFNREKLKQKRTQLGMTLEQVASLTSSSKSYIWEMENRKIEPSGKKLLALSKALGEPPEWFYDLPHIDRTKEVLGTLIALIAQSSLGTISPKDAGELLKKLNGQHPQ